MPQFAQIATTYASQIFWLVIVFGLIYTVIGLGMLPKIGATVAARNDKITSDLAAAEAARATADQTEAAYRGQMEQARAAALKAKADAKSAATLETEKKVKAVDAELAEKAAAADASLKAAQARAIGEIESVAAEAAQEIVARVSGLTVDKTAAEQAVKAALAA
jgi:F-type H+-transporting ATPase subunit b